MEEKPESAQTADSSTPTEQQPKEKEVSGGGSTVTRAEHPTGSSFTGAATNERQV